MTNKRKLGEAYRLETLLLLSELGYMSTRQVALGAYGKCDISSRKMASRMLRGLLDRKLIVEKRDGDTVAGERLVALSQAGVNALRERVEMPGERAHGRDWLRHAHSHRTACNSVYLAVARRWLESAGWTELQIAAGMAPAALVPFQFRCDGQPLQKVPDVLYESPRQGDAPVWFEVENTYRSGKDLSKVVAFLRAVFAQPAPKLSRVCFVVTSEAARSIGKRIRAAMTHSLESGWSAAVKELDRDILANRLIFMRLNEDTLTMSPLE